MRDWLPLVLHHVDPWLSDRDISAGERWSTEIGKELEGSHFGIVFLTADNLDAPWLLFEAGALSKAFSAAGVCPYLIDVDLKDLTGPLAQFQAKKAERSSTFELVQAINARSTTPIDQSRLSELFDALWSRLEGRLLNLPSSETTGAPPARSLTDAVEELVKTVRRLEAKLEQPVREVGRKPTVELRVGNGFEAIKEIGPLRLLLDRDIISEVAKVCGLDPQQNEKDWWLTDVATGRHVNVDNQRKILARARAGDSVVLELADIPF